MTKKYLNYSYAFKKDSGTYKYMEERIDTHKTRWIGLIDLYSDDIIKIGVYEFIDKFIEYIYKDGKYESIVRTVRLTFDNNVEIDEFTKCINVLNRHNILNADYDFERMLRQKIKGKIKSGDNTDMLYEKYLLLFRGKETFSPLIFKHNDNYDFDKLFKDNKYTMKYTTDEEVSLIGDETKEELLKLAGNIGLCRFASNRFTNFDEDVFIKLVGINGDDDYYPVISSNNLDINFEELPRNTISDIIGNNTHTTMYLAKNGNFTQRIFETLLDSVDITSHIEVSRLVRINIYEPNIKLTPEILTEIFNLVNDYVDSDRYSTYYNERVIKLLLSLSNTVQSSLDFSNYYNKLMDSINKLVGTRDSFNEGVLDPIFPCNKRTRELFAINYSSDDIIDISKYFEPTINDNVDFIIENITNNNNNMYKMIRNIAKDIDKRQLDQLIYNLNAVNKCDIVLVNNIIVSESKPEVRRHLLINHIKQLSNRLTYRLEVNEEIYDDLLSTKLLDNARMLHRVLSNSTNISGDKIIEGILRIKPSGIQDVLLLLEKIPDDYSNDDIYDCIDSLVESDIDFDLSNITTFSYVDKVFNDIVLQINPDEFEDNYIMSLEINCGISDRIIYTRFDTLNKIHIGCGCFTYDEVLDAIDKKYEGLELLEDYKVDVKRVMLKSKSYYDKWDLGLDFGSLEE